MFYQKKEIKMLPLNPRYTNLEEITIKNLESSTKNNEDIARELLQYEGDFKDLLELLESIEKNGFLTLNDKILLHLDKYKEKFYVLEGNRRLLALNLINQNINFQKVCGSEPYFSNTNLDDWKNNKNKVIEQLNSMSNTHIKLEDNWFSDTSDIGEEIIWKAIYSKHVGEQVGKRNWSRAKYFDDLLKKYEKLKKTKSNKEAIEELSSLFGKKTNIIKQDIKSSIWIIKSIEIYNETHPKQKIDLKQMEVSGYELVLSQRVVFEGRQETLREILGISIDDDQIKLNYDYKKIKRNNFANVISFLVESAQNKGITTRKIKDEVSRELGEKMGYEIHGIRSLEHTYKSLQEKSKKNETTDLEKSKLEFLRIIDLNFSTSPSREVIDELHDSHFIKAIKYTIRNDFKMIRNLANFAEEEFPFTNVSLTIRNIIDLLILEFFHRNFEIVKERNYELKISNEGIKDLEEFISNYGKPEEHEVNTITSIFMNLINKFGSSRLTTFVTESVNAKYGNRLESLGIDFNSDSIKSSIQKMLDFKKKTSDSIPIKEASFQNFSLLNNLVHKPYFGFVYKNEKKMIDNLTTMFLTVKNFLTEVKIIKISK